MDNTIQQINGRPVFSIVKQLLDMGVMYTYNERTGKHERVRCMYEEDGRIRLDVKLRSEREQERGE